MESNHKDFIEDVSSEDVSNVECNYLFNKVQSLEERFELLKDEVFNNKNMFLECRKSIKNLNKDIYLFYSTLSELFRIISDKTKD